MKKFAIILSLILLLPILSWADTHVYGSGDSEFLEGYTWESPGTIGSTTPSTGKFTTFEATGTAILNDTVSIKRGSSAGLLRWYEPSGSGTNYLGITVPAMAGDTTYTLWTALPSIANAPAVCSTNGTFSWGDQAILTTSSPTFAGMALGSGSLTLSGSIAATGSRVTKGWFTDLEITNAPTINGASSTGTGGIVLSAAPAITFAEVDGSATGSLSAANVSRTVVNSYGRGAAATLTLPAGAAGYAFTAIVGTQHNSAWKIQRAGADTIYFNGVSGKTYFQETNQAVGSYVSCTTFKVGAAEWSWLCSEGSGTWVTD